MATTTDPQTPAQADTQTAAGAVQLAHVPVAQVTVPDGFNPRGEVTDDKELEQLADTIRRHGCLQPIRVQATDNDTYLLVAGERRYRAALKAGLAEIPAIVRPARTGDQAEQADRLVEALIENDQRRDLDGLSRARGYQRLLDSGLTVKGVAEQLGTTQARVREHLRILKLPEHLQDRVAEGAIPLRAVKPLAQLESIHPGLAAAGAGEVLCPDDGSDPYTWADLEQAPLTVALSAGNLPNGAYRVHTPYPVEAFALSDDARNDLQALERLLGQPIETLRFDSADLEQARALGAAHGEGWQSIIVGAEVAGQLAGDYLARAVKTQRQRLRDERRAAQSTQTPTERAEQDADARVEDPGGAERDAEQARRAQREADRQARERATRFNLELGRGLYTSLARVRVDETVLKLLASVDITGHLSDVAMRGARYGLPGWVTESTQRNGNTKYGYSERAEAEQRATQFLAAAARTGEIAGRLLVLVAMAVYADQDAVAASNRSWHEVKVSGPWAGEFDALLDGLVADKLPAGTLAVLNPVLERRREQQTERAVARHARAQAAARLDGIEQRIEELTVEEVEHAERDLDAASTGWTPRYSELRHKLAARRQQLTGQSASD